LLDGEAEVLLEQALEDIHGLALSSNDFPKDTIEAESSDPMGTFLRNTPVRAFGRLTESFFSYEDFSPSATMAATIEPRPPRGAEFLALSSLRVLKGVEDHLLSLARSRFDR